MTTGLKGGQKEGGEFFFLSDRCDIFKNIFGDGLKNVRFDADCWNNFFDGEDKKKDIERGFLHGHLDLGWGRCGVHQKTSKSQTKSGFHIRALPHMINKGHAMYKKLGNIPDLIQTFCDQYVFEDGKRLMPCHTRDLEFGQELRKESGQQLSRFEAYTIVRQPMDKKKGLSGTHRHIDGPNCSKVGYQTTCVFSFLCNWKDEQFRMACICYTRNSCYHWTNDNSIAFHFREKMKDYVIDSNGGIYYNHWCLKEDMSQHKVLTDKSLDKTVPSETVISNDLFKIYKKRNPESTWTNRNELAARKMVWTHHTGWKNCCGDEVQLDSRIIKVAEFVNRFGFVSSYAHIINVFQEIHMINRAQIIEMIYAALLTPSQIQFHHIASSMLKNWSDDWASKNLFKEYHSMCHRMNLKWGGGPLCRFRGQSDRDNDKLKSLFRFGKNKELKINLDKLNTATNDLEKGSFLNRKGELTKTLESYQVQLINGVASLSFPSLCCFTGLCTSEKATMTAKLVKPNMTRYRQSYLTLMTSWLNERLAPRGIDVEQTMIDPNKIKKMWTATGDSLGWVQATMENGTCAMFRKKKRHDVYFERQRLYNIKNHSNDTFVREWNSTEWKKNRPPNKGRGTD